MSRVKIISESISAEVLTPLVSCVPRNMRAYGNAAIQNATILPVMIIFLVNSSRACPFIMLMIRVKMLPRRSDVAAKKIGGIYCDPLLITIGNIPQKTAASITRR